jgi:hypothetical protein
MGKRAYTVGDFGVEVGVAVDGRLLGLQGDADEQVVLSEHSRDGAGPEEAGRAELLARY